MRAASRPRAGMVLLLWLAAATPRPCAAARHALLVGIDRYPCIKAADLQLYGAKKDVEQMGLLLRYRGFRVRELQGPRATGARIRQAMHSLSARVQPRDEAVLYFSGRGSVAFDPARPSSKMDLEPTLVPFDGQAGAARADIRMGDLERWARLLTAKRVAVTIIVDACYTSLAARGEDRFYKNVPRCMVRPGKPRPTLYRGPGVFLAATDARGQAYEWRVDFNSNTWSGAFTDYWTGAAMGRLKRGQSATYAEVMRDVRAYFRGRPGYMPGLRPYPAQEAMSPLYGRPVFDAGESPASASSDVGPAVDRIVKNLKEREKTLRVALDVLPGDEGIQALAPLSEPFQEYLQSKLQGVVPVPQYADRSDRVVYLRRSTTGLDVVVKGDEVDESRGLKFRGRDIADLMQNGLADYLQRQQYVLRLFGLTESAGDQTLKVAWSARSEKPRYRRGERFAYLVDTPTEGLLYLLDQDQADGIVQMVWPLRHEWNNRQAAGASRVPKIAMMIPEKQAPGRTLTRAIFVAPPPAPALPSLRPPGKEWESDAAYSKAELAHLRALLDVLERKQVRWAAITFYYDVAD